VSQLPSISVITPCINAAATISGTLESVRAQGYPRLEHLVVDGGSTDSTPDLLRAAPGIRWISEPDRGRVDAANKGARMATGDVIAWLNADDRYLAGALHLVAEAFAENPRAAWASGYCMIVDAEGREVRRAVSAYKRFLVRRWSFPLYLTQNFLSDPATFIRRRAFEEVGPLDERYRESHDYDLWLRVARRHGAPVLIERDLACFRMTEGTLSMSRFEHQFQEHRAIARRHGDGHPIALAANRVMSTVIPAVYRVLRLARRAAIASA
jgi:glycosyltransferase involved in cell wall biosynthesis